MDEVRWPDYARHSAWGLDFIRAMLERPLWARILFQLCMGEKAYREFIGLMNAIDRDFGVFVSYSAGGAKYHDDKMPAWWWIERPPMPLKEYDE